MAYNFTAEMVGLGLVHGAEADGQRLTGNPFSSTLGSSAMKSISVASSIAIFGRHGRIIAARKQRRAVTTSPPWAIARVTEAVNADIAASTQKLFEETYLKAVRSLDRMLSGGGIRTNNLCLSGGTALNCRATAGFGARTVR